MRFPQSTSIPAALLAIVVGLGVAIAAGGGGIRHSIKDRLPETTIAAMPELDAELQTRAAVQPRSDGDMEDQASRPIQTVVEAARGDTLLDLLLKAGVDKPEANKAIDALKVVYNPRALRVGQEVTVTFERPADGIAPVRSTHSFCRPTPAARFRPNGARAGSPSVKRSARSAASWPASAER